MPDKKKSFSEYQSTNSKIEVKKYKNNQNIYNDIYKLRSILSTRVIILTNTAFLSLYITFCNYFNYPILSILSITHRDTFLIANIAMGLLSIFYSMPVITNGIKNLIKKKADNDTMSTITAVICLMSVIIELNQNAKIYMPYMQVGILALLFNAIGKLLIIRRVKRNFKLLSKYNLEQYHTVCVCDEDRVELNDILDFPVISTTMRNTNSLTDILRYSYTYDISDFFCCIMIPIYLIGSIIISLFLTFVKTGTSLSINSLLFCFLIFSMFVCSSSCIALPLVTNISMEKISIEILKKHGIIFGWQSVYDLYDTNCILIEASKLFPYGTVKLSEIKLFSNTYQLDEILLKAASITHHSDSSIIKQIFADIILGKKNLLYKIENYSYEEKMGFCGWINNQLILLGNRELMISHNIKIDGIHDIIQNNNQNSELLYLSISGALTALFVLEFTANATVKKLIKNLEKKKIYIIIESIDQYITQKRISSLYGISKTLVKVISKHAEPKKTIHTSSSILFTEKFSSMANLILGIKLIYSTSVIGIIIQTLSILFGFVICLILIISGTFEFNCNDINYNITIIIYQIICTIITYIAVSVKKI